MSENYQPGYGQPQGATPPPAAPWPPSTILVTPGLSEADAKRSRRWRTVIGVALILTGLAAGGIAALQALNVGGFGDDDPLVAMAVAGYNVILGLVLIGFGVWNLAARRTLQRGPLIAAAIVSGIQIVVGAFNLIDFAVSSGRFPPLGGIIVQIVILRQAIVLLRLKRT
ncbi:hypothetical protein SPF06_04750 [Sinomonas sp. JGH33]|uniref:Integral membrane protein n=1 Tax=Sinomonas terricola TaxID=3110330 RepID=A0ABU5T2Z2_9MICC|nr:hypothetical protein [Sinomonas sp. JGH33]MEA5454027.1 hypothetical protein [Sinomonas sp. JGH33]